MATILSPLRKGGPPLQPAASRAKKVGLRSSFQKILPTMTMRRWLRGGRQQSRKATRNARLREVITAIEDLRREVRPCAPNPSSQPTSTPPACLTLPTPSPPGPPLSSAAPPSALAMHCYNARQVEQLEPKRRDLLLTVELLNTRLGEVGWLGWLGTGEEQGRLGDVARGRPPPDYAAVCLGRRFVSAQLCNKAAPPKPTTLRQQCSPASPSRRCGCA